MSIEVSFYFKTEKLDGYYTFSEALKIDPEGSQSRINQIKESKRNKRMVKDGFQPGWQENIQSYAGGRLDYDRQLRERGLIEMGKDAKITTVEKEFNPFETDEMIKEVIDSGADLSGGQLDALKSGELFKDV